MDSDDTAIRENPGLVNVTDLKNFYPMGMPHKGADGPTNYAQRYTAHLYGECVLPRLEAACPSLILAYSGSFFTLR